MGNHRTYYREVSHLRGEPCANAGKMWRCEHAEAAVDRIIRGMATDNECLAQIDREARRLPDRDDGERKELEAKRRRAKGPVYVGVVPPIVAIYDSRAGARNRSE